jgi:hypothetical protein
MTYAVSICFHRLHALRSAAHSAARVSTLAASRPRPCSTTRTSSTKRSTTLLSVVSMVRAHFKLHLKFPALLVTFVQEGGVADEYPYSVGCQAEPSGHAQGQERCCLGSHEGHRALVQAKQGRLHQGHRLVLVADPAFDCPQRRWRDRD